MGIAVQTDMAMPPILAFEAPRSRSRSGPRPRSASIEVALFIGITEPNPG